MAWLGAAALAAILGMFALLVAEDRRELIAEAETRASENALLLSEHAARLFESAELALSTVSDELREGLTMSPRRSWHLHKRFRRLANRLPYVEAFWLYDARGVLQLSSLAFPAPALDASDKDYFVVHRQRMDAGVFVSSPVTSGTDRPTFRLSRRLENPKGEFAGIASVTLEVPFFRNFYGRLPLPQGSCVSLRRASDLALVISHPPSEDEIIPGLRAALARQVAGKPVSGMFHLAPRPGEEDGHIVAYRMAPGFPLYVTVNLPLTEVRRAWLGLIALRFGEAVAAATILAALTWLGMRQARRQAGFQEVLEARVAERTSDLEQINSTLEVAIQEVHHRVRNNLQTVASLLTLQAAEVSEPGVSRALAESIGRVHAIGLVHQMLYDSGAITRLPFGTYLARLAAEIGDIMPHAAEIPIAVHGLNPRFSLDLAVPLALIVHEILSNALQHAFRHDKGGHIEILLHHQGEDWHLCIYDDGIGLPGDFRWESAHTGLGLRIVRSLADQIGATAHLHTADGTRFTLRWHRIDGEDGSDCT